MTDSPKTISWEFPRCPHQFDGWCVVCVREIADQARKEGFEEGKKERKVSDTLDALKYAQGPTPYERGFAQALEMAAKVAEKRWGKHGANIADLIRALQPPREGAE